VLSNQSGNVITVSLNTKFPDIVYYNLHPYNWVNLLKSLLRNSSFLRSAEEETTACIAYYPITWLNYLKEWDGLGYSRKKPTGNETKESTLLSTTSTPLPWQPKNTT